MDDMFFRQQILQQENLNMQMRAQQDQMRNDVRMQQDILYELMLEEDEKRRKRHKGFYIMLDTALYFFIYAGFATKKDAANKTTSFFLWIAFFTRVISLTYESIA